MGNLVKQTVNSVVFMDNMSHADDVRCLTLEIDCEGAAVFLGCAQKKRAARFIIENDPGKAGGLPY